jgi:hypothetical protein
MMRRRAAMMMVAGMMLGACAGAQRSGDPLQVGPLGDAPEVWAAWQEEPYPLDGERRTFGRGASACPEVQLVEYAGDILPYHKPVQVNPFFRERLVLFEDIVARVAIKHYGRPPLKIRHFGAHVCRKIDKRRAQMSEHGLGNALDVGGFIFGPDPAQSGPLSEPFTVMLKDHWDGGDGVLDAHARFLRDLAREIALRPDVFRGMIGPHAPGHDDHFHLDMAPSRYMRF